MPDPTTWQQQFLIAVKALDIVAKSAPTSDLREGSRMSAGDLREFYRDWQTGAKRAALEAHDEFKGRVRAADVKKAALDVVAEYENRKKAAPGDEPAQPGDPIQRDEPAAEPQQHDFTHTPADNDSETMPAERAEEVAEEANPEVENREMAENALSDEGTVEAVMAFLKAEDFIGAYGLEIEESHEDRSVAVVSFRGNSEYYVAANEDVVERIAVARVKSDLEDNPDNFNSDFIENYINIDSLRDMLMSDVEEHVRESPESYGWEAGKDSDGNEIVRYNAEGEEDDSGEYDSDGQPISEESGVSDDWVESKAEELLKDPLEYLREIYGDETMAKAIEIAGINVQEAADDAVAADGAGHFLSSYDGETHDLIGGGVWWRSN